MELKLIGQMLRRWSWLLVIGLLVGGGIGYAISIYQTPEYLAGTKILVMEPLGENGSNVNNLNDKELAETYMQLLTTQPILESVSEKVGQTVKKAQIRVTRVRDTGLVEVTVRDTDASRAALTANAIVEVLIDYNEALSHQIYAGSDFLIMPSRVEPCGLNQMYAMRYGTIPIVRSIGGLKDTVPDIGEPDGQGRGIRFDQFSMDDAVYALHRAISMWHSEPDVVAALCRRIMAVDFSWEQTIGKYRKVYRSIGAHIDPVLEPAAEKTGPAPASRKAAKPTEKPAKKAVLTGKTAAKPAKKPAETEKSATPIPPAAPKEKTKKMPAKTRPAAAPAPKKTGPKSDSRKKT